LQIDLSVDDLYQQLKRETEQSGYYLNPDVEFVKMLLESLLTNEERYGYRACPCRLASGNKVDDIDIICPCDYRDSDLAEFGMCYCALYVSSEIADGKREAEPIPDRRPTEEERKVQKTLIQPEGTASGLPYPVWRCRVCGYLCARDDPPKTCPICQAKEDRFERFI